MVQVDLSQYEKNWTLWKDPIRRTALLRDLIEVVHAKRTELLANGDKKGTQSLEVKEKSLLSHIGHDLSTLNFDDLYRPQTHTKKPKLEGHSLWSRHLEPAKLARFDRALEKQLAYHAQSLGWSLWSLQATLNPKEVQLFHENLKKELWPQSIILYVETHGLLSENEWTGLWFIIAEHGTHLDSITSRTTGQWTLLEGGSS